MDNTLRYMMWKRSQYLIFSISLLLYFMQAEFVFFLLLELIYILFLLYRFKIDISSGFPLGIIVASVFIIENCLAPTLIYLWDRENAVTGAIYYLFVPIEDYLPFAFLTAQVILIGYDLIKVPSSEWIYFIKNIHQNIDIRTVYSLFVVGGIGLLLQTFNINAISFVSYTLSNLFVCGLIGLAIYYKKVNNIYLILGLTLQIISSIRTGMFGSLVVFLSYVSIIVLLILVSQNRKINWGLILLGGFVAVLFIGVLQNVKSDYREQTWSGTKEAGSGSFYESVRKNVNNDVTDIEYYMPAIYRLNQGYLVSATMIKVPSEQPYVMGETIINSIANSLIPRFLYPTKEEAGGREKIARFTNLTLVGNTSMNIGLLGEAYVNFGKEISIIFFLLWGAVLALAERKMLVFSKTNPVIILVFPLFFQVLLGTGTDFLYVINTIVKSTLIILLLFTFFRIKGKI
ncbi:MAG TPA: hypothetical protein DCQ29_12660 [Chitinophagaceae bacterium]|nr:hypothetical protein [Chitinophagaceae bacterium]